jgi:hypothetical protein
VLKAQSWFDSNFPSGQANGRGEFSIAASEKAPADSVIDQRARPPLDQLHPCALAKAQACSVEVFNGFSDRRRWESARNALLEESVCTKIQLSRNSKFVTITTRFS